MSIKTSANPASNMATTLAPNERGADGAVRRLFVGIGLVCAPLGVVLNYIALLPDEAALLREHERLVTQRAVLAAIEKIVPESERSRVGIDRLIEITERGLTASKRQILSTHPNVAKGSATPGSAPQKGAAPAAGWAFAAWWRQATGDTVANRNAKEILTRSESQR